MSADGIYGFFNEYRWLSNFWNCNVLFDGILYPSSECAYQAHKVFDNNDDRKLFATVSASKSKKLSRKIGMLQKYADPNARIALMEAIVRAKFSQNKDLEDLLINTGEKYLEETNTLGDDFWGVCNGQGKNNLGIILMKIRKELSDARNFEEVSNG